MKGRAEKSEERVGRAGVAEKTERSQPTFVAPMVGRINTRIPDEANPAEYMAAFGQRPKVIRTPTARRRSNESRRAWSSTGDPLTPQACSELCSCPHDYWFRHCNAYLDLLYCVMCQYLSPRACVVETFMNPRRKQHQAVRSSSIRAKVVLPSCII